MPVTRDDLQDLKNQVDTTIEKLYDLDRLVDAMIDQTDESDSSPRSSD